MTGVCSSIWFRLCIGLGAAVVFLGLVFLRTTRAQQAIPLPVEDALRMRSFGGRVAGRFSPDGKSFAYTVQDKQRKRPFDSQSYALTDHVPPWGVGADIYVLNVATGDSKNLTEGKGNSWLPVWSPDGRTLAFLSDRGDEDHSRLWVWDTARNELRKVCNVRVRAEQIEWTRDSREILITAVPELVSTDEEVRKKSALVEQQDLALPQNSDSTVILYSAARTSPKDGLRSDPFNLDVKLLDLILVNVSHGTSRTVVKGRRIGKYRISPDGSLVAYSILKRFERPGSQQVLFDLATSALETQEGRVLESDIRLSLDGAKFSWSPDSLRLAFRKGGPDEQTRDIYVVDVDGGGSQKVSALPGMAAYDAGIPTWDASGKNIYFLENGTLWSSSLERRAAQRVAEIPGRKIVRLIERSHFLWTPPSARETIVVTHDDSGKQDGFYRVDLEEGSSSALLERRQCYLCTNVEEWQFADMSSDGQSVAFYAEDAQHSADLWLSDSGFRTVRRLTHLNPEIDKVVMGSVRVIEWLSDDGQRLKGALLLPSNYERGKHYPLITWVYGGLLKSNGANHFGLEDGPFNLQLLATRGYAVLIPDAPQHLGTPMLDLAKTVLPGVNLVVDMGIADPERLGVMGHSYGGYSTLCLIVQTKRFKAALAADGMADLVSFYGQMGKDGAAFGTSITEQGQGLMGGTPWEFGKRYLTNSPFFYLDRVETPLLIIHGESDQAIAAFLSDEIFVGLRRLGKEVEYAKYGAEGHSPLYWSYANQVDFCNRMIAWFDKYLKSAAPQSSPSPSLVDHE